MDQQPRANPQRYTDLFRHSTARTLSHESTRRSRQPRIHSQPSVSKSLAHFGTKFLSGVSRLGHDDFLFCLLLCCPGIVHQCKAFAFTFHCRQMRPSISSACANVVLITGTCAIVMLTTGSIAFLSFGWVRNDTPRMSLESAIALKPANLTTAAAEAPAALEANQSRRAILLETVAKQIAARFPRPRLGVGSICFGYTGLARIVHHRAIYQSFAEMSGSLKCSGFRPLTFMYIDAGSGSSSDDPHEGIKGVSFRNADPLSPRGEQYNWTEAMETYMPAVLRMVRSRTAESMEFDTSCRARVPADHDLSEGTKLGGTFNWLQQFHKVSVVHRMIEEYERSVGDQCEFIVRVRTDMLFLESFAPHFLSNHQTASVPFAMMSRRAELLYRHNDHFFVCPRHLCAKYFEGPIQWYRACKIPELLLPQALFVNQFPKGTLSTMHLFYTIARAHSARCVRLHDNWFRTLQGRYPKIQRARMKDFGTVYKWCGNISSNWNNDTWLRSHSMFIHGSGCSLKS